MTQRQLDLKFYSLSGLCTWAGLKNGLLYLNGDEGMPYIQNQMDGLYYYFGLYGLKPHQEYRLVGMSSKDLGEN